MQPYLSIAKQHLAELRVCLSHIRIESDDPVAQEWARKGIEHLENTLDTLTKDSE